MVIKGLIWCQKMDMKSGAREESRRRGCKYRSYVKKSCTDVKTIVRHSIVKSIFGGVLVDLEALHVIGYFKVIFAKYFYNCEK